MINHESFQAIAQGAIPLRTGGTFVRPNYETYGFAQIPQTIRSLLTGDPLRGVPLGAQHEFYDRYDNVILLFLDAFGWRFVERYLDSHPFLKRILDRGVVNKITSQFPSTTAAHVTAIHTGQHVGQSGVYEWFYYEPQLDAVIAPLLFSFAGDQDRDTLLSTGIRPEQIFPSTTLYQDLAQHGVTSYVIQDHRYTESPYTHAVTCGAKLVPYRSLAEGLATMIEILEHEDKTPSRNYYFLYYDKIDSVCHQNGPNSLQLEAEIHAVLDLLESFFHTSLSKRAGQRPDKRTMLLITADHAQVEADPKTTVYLNKTLPQLTPLLKQTRAGRPIVPAGSPRDFFLHVREECIDEAEHLLKAHTNDIADVCRTGDLIQQGFFGPTASLGSSALKSRIGDLVVLPYPGESVWWYEQGIFQNTFYGLHGGLSAQEMETVLLALPYC